MDPADKVRENRYRRVLDRRGYTLSRFRTRDKQALTYGQYTISAKETQEPSRRQIVATLSDLDAVEEWLNTSRPGVEM